MILFLIIIGLSFILPGIILFDRYYVSKLPKDHKFKKFWNKHIIDEFKEDMDI
jgi:hypothetical protein